VRGAPNLRCFLSNHTADSKSEFDFMFAARCGTQPKLSDCRKVHSNNSNAKTHTSYYVVATTMIRAICFPSISDSSFGIRRAETSHLNAM
jgi:hypothetical protein